MKDIVTAKNQGAAGAASAAAQTSSDTANFEAKGRGPTKLRKFSY